MKIFPPLSEMLWPPGLSTTALLWRRRYLMLVVIVITAGSLAWSGLYTNDEPKTSNPARISADLARLDGASCSSLTRQSGNKATRAQPCAAFRIRLGPSVRANKALKRAALPANPGTLTAADRAIVRPQILRSTVWDGSAPPAQAPAVALSPKPN